MDKCFICHNLRILGEGKNFQWVIDRKFFYREAIVAQKHTW